MAYGLKACSCHPLNFIVRLRLGLELGCQGLGLGQLDSDLEAKDLDSDSDSGGVDSDSARVDSTTALSLINLVFAVFSHNMCSIVFCHICMYLDNE